MDKIILPHSFLKKLDELSGDLRNLSQRVIPENFSESNIGEFMWRLLIVTEQVGMLHKLSTKKLVTKDEKLKKTYKADMEAEAADLLVQVLILNHILSLDVSSQIKKGIARFLEKIKEVEKWEINKRNY